MVVASIGCPHIILVAAMVVVSLVELPVVEKLQLSELMEEQDESVDEDELQRFRELKDKMILLDKAELGSTAQGDRNPKSHLIPVIKSLSVRKKATTKASVIPELPLFDTRHRKRPEERRQAAMKELKEKQAILEQRRKSQEALQKITQEEKKKVSVLEKKKVSVLKKHAEQRKQKEAEADRSDTQSQTSCISITECEENRSARVMERQIRARVETIQDRRRNPRVRTTEQLAATDQDLEEMRKLQTRLLERKRNPGRDLGKCFTIITGDTWPSFTDE